MTRDGRAVLVVGSARPMARSSALAPLTVERKIVLLRGERVTLDADLAALYGGRDELREGMEHRPRMMEAVDEPRVLVERRRRRPRVEIELRPRHTWPPP